ncbi:MAG: peptidylprolyl isomerase [Rhodocyclaceae bacterium]|nr:peptidylprolyl isomerase [Rhodocyclaceae bacterium]
MQIAKDTVVTLNYRVTDSDGNLVDEGQEPLVYLHGGYGGIFGKIEETLQGKTTGDEFNVRLEPEDAFGDYDAELVMIEPRNLFPDNIEVGMQFERATEEGEDDELYTITDIADDKVVVDGNHPLAGMALLFACSVTDVRAASAEEVSHGHVHAPGGHHHH